MQLDTGTLVRRSDFMHMGSWYTHPTRDEPNLLLFRLVRFDGFRAARVLWWHRLVGEE